MVIPLGDRNPTRRRAWLTWTFIALNVGVFLFAQPWGADQCEQVDFFLDWAAVPAELTQGAPLDSDDLTGTVADRCDVAPRPDKPVYATILFSMFLHAGWLHLGGNMLYLAIFGNNVEDRFGHLAFVGFYLLSGLIATVAFVGANPDSPGTLVGASGAIAGVLGAYLVLFPRSRVTVSVPILLFVVVQLPAAVVLGLWFVLQLQGLGRPEVAAGGGVAYLAHAAGFVAGAVVTLLVGRRPRDRRSPGRRWRPPRG